MIKFLGMPTDQARQLRLEGRDAYDRPVETKINESKSSPCRHCLQNIPVQQKMIVCAYRLFSGLHAYAETGPIFLCSNSCKAFKGPNIPSIFADSPDFLMKAYNAKERIIYGSGSIVPSDSIEQRAAALLDDTNAAFVDIRSARNNCWLARAVRR